jgi:Zn-dependent peptidase ImmA (M78 family)/RNA polymerase subunit RPABC4/transcription elongation factor Spt4
MANEFLIAENIRSFPIDPIAIIKAHGWRLKLYSRVTAKAGLKISNLVELAEHIGSKDAVVTLDKKNKYLICYNDLIFPMERIIFSLAHEIGHIVLRHLEDFDCSTLERGVQDWEYDVLEAEANTFASNLLAPVFILDSLRKPLRESYHTFFNISRTAWRVRMLTMELDREHTPKYILEAHEILFREFMYHKHCQICDAYFIGSKDTGYCPICGSIQLRREKAGMKYRDGVQLDEKGRAQECPQCHNEEISTSAEYCKICGTRVVNRCTSEQCGQIAQGNSRYCERCGTPTTFYFDGSLCEWKVYKEPTGDENQSLSANRITPADEDDLPF